MTRKSVTEGFLKSEIRRRFGDAGLEIVFTRPPRSPHTNGANWSAGPHGYMPNGKRIGVAGFARAGDIVRDLQASFDLD